MIHEAVPTQDAGEHAEHRQPHHDLAGEIGRAHRCHAPVQRAVSLLVLNGMPALVRRDAVCGHRVAVKIVRREDEALVRGVVVVAQHFVVREDFHVADAGALEDGGRHFRPGGARGCGNLTVTEIDALHAGRGPK